MPFLHALTRFVKNEQEDNKQDVIEMLKKIEGFKLLAIVQMSPSVSAIFKPKLPIKCKDPGACTIPCQIGNAIILEALIDLRAATNVIPTHIYSSLNMGDLQDYGVMLQLANRSIRRSKGFLEDILVKVKDLVFLANFYVLDM
ncbi:uncharacterized protein LOC129289947 [Prosopis cineraria]|uniref:uncharacterized protein LOC129289947 n=1 Tax=Prosopis cineraria TaxID=364024 RepID=UPI00240F3E14|nr:uncharacterized protein LOC129289947 [Prosopis cineraria]